MNRLEKITDIAHDIDTTYQYIQDVLALVYEETGVDLQ